MPKITFSAGAILTASAVNTYFMDQAVMTFTSASDRSSQLPSPVEGMISYLSDTDTLEIFTRTTTSATNAWQPLGGKPTYNASVSITPATGWSVTAEGATNGGGFNLFGNFQRTGANITVTSNVVAGSPLFIGTINDNKYIPPSLITFTTGPSGNVAFGYITSLGEVAITHALGTSIPTNTLLRFGVSSIGK